MNGMKIIMSVILSVFLSINRLSAHCEKMTVQARGGEVKIESAELKKLKVIVEDEKGKKLVNVTIISGRDGKIYTTNIQGECEIPGLKKNDELTFILEGFKTSVLIFETEIYSSTISYQLSKGKKNKREIKYFYDPLRKR